MVFYEMRIPNLVEVRFEAIYGFTTHVNHIRTRRQGLGARKKERPLANMPQHSFNHLRPNAPTKITFMHTNQVSCHYYQGHSLGT